MNIGQLFGFAVKSTSVIIGDKCLRLKSGNGEFIMSDSAQVLRSDDYIIIDTGKPHKGLHDEAARVIKGHSAYAFGMLRANCVRGLYPFLYLLGEKYQPTVCWHYIPSVYLKHILRD